MRVRVAERRRPLCMLGTVAALLTLLLPTVAAAGAGSITDLGKPTNTSSTNAYFPLSGFRRDSNLPTIMRLGDKAQVLVIGTLSPRDPYSADERWPMVKALDEFGSLSHIGIADQSCKPDSYSGQTLCIDPSYDWSSATYSSSYLVFEHKDIVGADQQSFQRLTPTQNRLYVRLSHVPLGVRVLPIVAIGDYVETASQLLVGDDYEHPLPAPTLPPKDSDGYPSGSMYVYSGLTFQQVQTALQTRKDPSGSNIVEDVNAEANIIEALICHADGGKPRSVCGRAIVRSLQKRLH